jgi:hypothetical protein
MNENLKAALKTLGAHHENVKQDIDQWLNNELFTWNWWILVTFIILPLLLWIKVFDRKRILELLLVWTLVIIPTSYLDSIGVDLEFWVYPVQFIPLTPRAIPFDFFMVGIVYMILYQYFSSWSRYLTALVIMASTYAFIGEPVSHALNLVYYLKWNYFYSFVYYIILGVSVKAIVNKSRDMYRKET